jgi:hypothetical protein
VEINFDIIALAKTKAKQSNCRYKVAALGFNRKGDFIGSAVNKQKLYKHHGGQHAEMELLRKYGKKIRNIIICRMNNSGDFLPIKACENCSKVLGNLGIKIYSIS